MNEIIEKLNRKVKKNTEEERRMDRIFVCILGLLGFFILIGVAAIVLYFVSKTKNSLELSEEEKKPVVLAVPVSVPINFDEKQFEELVPCPVIDLQTLEMHKNPGISKH